MRSLDFVDRDFLPVLLGGDINVYSMARAFYEAYQVRSVGFGKYRTGPAYQSLLVDYTADPSIDTDEGFERLVNGFARDHEDKRIVLIGCGDSYVAIIARHKDKGALPPNVIAPYGPHQLMEQCQNKDVFYRLCERHGVPYPHTFVFDSSMLPADASAPIPALDDLAFPYPAICKPSDGIAYWEHPFPTQKKAYEVSTRQELEGVIRSVYAAGYPGELILQDRIPGNDERMRVLTSYSDQSGTVRMMCLGHVLLEEHEPHAIGNHAAIITEPNPELMQGARRLLEDLHFVGFSNFDVKYDERDGTFKFFDFNTRQGRSNYYVTASGFNVARYVVEEYVYDRPFEQEFVTADEEFLWRVVPMGIIDRYVRDPSLRRRAHELEREGKSVNPLFEKGDFTIGRWLRMQKLMASHYALFKRYYGDHA